MVQDQGVQVSSGRELGFQGDQQVDGLHAEFEGGRVWRGG